MKITGKNSLAKYLSYFALFIFAFCALTQIYELIGYSILYYKHETGSHIFPNTFILNNDVGWPKNKWTIPMENLLKYKINFPNSNVQASTGIYNTSQMIYNSIAFLFLNLFFFLIFKTLREMSTDKIFNPRAIKWLKIFGYFNIFMAVISIISKSLSHSFDFVTLFQIFFSAFLGIMILFVVEFFKKGYQLQTENDLTI